MDEQPQKQPGSRIDWRLIQIGFVAMIVGLAVVMLAEGTGPPPSVGEAQAQKRSGVVIFAGGAVLALVSAVARYLKDRPKR